MHDKQRHQKGNSRLFKKGEEYFRKKRQKQTKQAKANLFGDNDGGRAEMSFADEFDSLGEVRDVMV